MIEREFYSLHRYGIILVEIYVSKKYMLMIAYLDDKQIRIKVPSNCYPFRRRIIDRIVKHL